MLKGWKKVVVNNVNNVNNGNNDSNPTFKTRKILNIKRSLN